MQQRISALDPLDDLPAPLFPQLVRFCGARGCRRRARPGGRHCADHHAAATRRWREATRRELNVRRRDAAVARADDQRLRDSARAKLAMALRRGQLTKGKCQECGTAAGVTAYMPDPVRWREVTWLCRDDRRAVVAGLAEEARRTAEREAWAERRATALAAIALLPPATQAELAVVAARGPGGLTLTPDAPLYGQRLIAEYERRFGASLSSLQHTA
jgi:hypothetical protein